MDATAPAPAGWSLGGRRALVTGSSRGIGRAIAIGLAGAGADMVVHYRADRAAANETAEAITALGRRVDVLQGNLAVPGGGHALAENALDRGFPVDIVVLNAAATVRRPFAEIEQRDVAANVQIGLAASMEILQVLLPSMVERGWGRVVAIGSIQQVRQNPAVHLYAAMKSATANVMENLAREYGPSEITFNTVAPGLIATDDTAPQLANPDTARALLDENPDRHDGRTRGLRRCGATALFGCRALHHGRDALRGRRDAPPGRPRFVATDGSIRQ